MAMFSWNASKTLSLDLCQASDWIAMRQGGTLFQIMYKKMRQIIYFGNDAGGCFSVDKFILL